MNALDDLYPNRLAELVARHPRLFRGEAPTWSTVPSGWFAIIDKLCCDLEALVPPGDDLPLWVEQITEKFGSLRFNLERLPEHDLDPNPHGLVVDEALQALHERACGLTWPARQATLVTCPGCGADTSDRENPMRNLCLACAEREARALEP